MIRYSLRELPIIVVGWSVSFGSGFVHPKTLGIFNLFIVPSVAMGVCMPTVLFMVKRLAITIGILLAFAGALGAGLSWAKETHFDFRVFVVLFCVTTAANLFITVPLTLLRRNSGPLDPRFK
jgi:hypothetical protein